MGESHRVASSDDTTWKYGDISLRRGWVFGLVALAVFAALPLVVAGERREIMLALNSLYLAGGTCLLALPLGTVLAVLLVRTDLPGRTAALFLLAAMLFVPLYLQTAAWDAGFGRQGWYAMIFGSLATPPLAGWRAVIWIHGMATVPWVTFLVAGGLLRLDPEWEEAALLDAAPAKVFWRITLPFAVDSLGLAALWVLLATLGEITVADMYQVNTYARELYIGFALGEFLVSGKNPDAAGTPLGAWPGVAISAWLAVAAVAFVVRVANWGFPPALRPPYRYRLGRFKAFGAAVVGMSLLLIVGVPLANLVYQAGIEVRQIGDDRFRTWSAIKFTSMLAESPRRFGSAIYWTLVMGAVTASLAVVLGSPLAWWGRRGGASALPALGVGVFGVAIPGPVIALALIAAMNRSFPPALAWVNDLYDYTIGAPVATLLLRTLPWAIFIGWFAFRSIPREMLESAELDGAGPMARFFWIAAPQRWTALALAWLVAFALATGDLTASILVLPPGLESLSVRIFGLIHAGVDDQVAALCLLIAFAVAVLGGLAWRFLKRTAW